MMDLNFSGIWDSTRAWASDSDGRRKSARISRAWIVGLTLVAFVILASLTPTGLPNGDGAVYAQQIQNKNFADRSVHLGYYAWGAVLTGWQSSFPDRALNVVSAVFGAGTIALLMIVGSYLTSGSLLGAVTVWLVSLGHLTLMEQWVYAEVYGPQTFFLVLAFVLMWSGRPIWAGIALANAVMITPSSLLAVPALCFAQPSVRPVVKLGLAGGSVTLGAITPVWGDYFQGNRGLLKASESSVDLKIAVLKEAVELVFGVFAFAPLMIFGVWALFRLRPLRPFVALLALLWAPAFFFGERFSDVPVQLALWALLVPLTALGARRLGTYGNGDFNVRAVTALVSVGSVVGLVPLWWVAAQRVDRLAAVPLWFAPLLLAVGFSLGVWLLVPNLSGRARVAAVLGLATLVNGLWVYGLVSHQNRQIDDYRQQVLDLEKQASDGFRFVGAWNRGILLEHYLFSRSYTGVWLNPAQLQGQWSEEEQRQAKAALTEAFQSGRELWFYRGLWGLESELDRHGYGLEEVGPEMQRARPPSGHSIPEVDEIDG